MSPYLSLIVCIIGLLIYVVTRPENGKTTEAGRIMFEYGLLAFLLTMQALTLPALHLGR
jgi:hypothetical protein